MSNGWIQIRFDGGEGWISMEYAQFPEEPFSTGGESPVSGSQPDTVPLPETLPLPLEPTIASPLPTCPGGTGPNGITAGGYPPERLTQEQRQWLFEQFGNTGIAPVGYGGQSCLGDFGSGEQNYIAFICRRADRGPGGILPGGYDPTSLTQEQRQWLWEQFGNIGIAPVGYGGSSCPVAPVPQCPSGFGPGGITASGFDPTTLSQDQRQWIWEQFGHTGIAPVGYGGESCNGGQPSLSPCPPGVGAPGGFDPTTLTQQQRNELFWAFGHTGEAPVGYGGEACYGGTMTLPSFAFSTPVPTPGTSENSNRIPVDYGGSTAVWSTSAQIIATTPLNIRSGAGTNYAIVGQAESGGYFEVIEGPVNGWFRIRFSGGEGWVNADYIMIVQNNQTTDDRPIVRLGLVTYVRSTPEIANANMFGTLNPGETYEVIGKSSNGYWLQINYYGDLGWICRGHTIMNDEGLMFLVPVTGFSNQDCYGAQTDTSTRGLELVKTCPNNAFWYDLYHLNANTRYVDLLLGSAPGYFIGTLDEAADILGVGVYILEGLSRPSADTVVINVWQIPGTSEYLVEEIRTSNGFEVFRRVERLTYNGAVRRCPFPVLT